MNKKGFTLIELIVCIAIIGVIAMIAVPSFSSYMAKYNQEQCNKQTLGVTDLYLSFIENENIPDSYENYNEFLAMNPTIKCPEDGVYQWNIVSKSLYCTKHTNIQKIGYPYYKSLYDQMKNDQRDMSDEEFKLKYGFSKLVAGGSNYLKWLRVEMLAAGYTNWTDSPDIIYDMITAGKGLKEGETLYEVPLVLKDDLIIFFSRHGSNFDQAQWKGDVIYCPYNGKFYKSTRIHPNGYADSTSVLRGAGTTDSTTISEYIKWLESEGSGWEEVRD